jgi:hypothetical protein
MTQQAHSTRGQVRQKKASAQLLAARTSPVSHLRFWQTLESRLYSSTKLTVPVNKFWLKPDSWLLKSPAVVQLPKTRKKSATGKRKR